MNVHAMQAQAACPMELAVYGEETGTAGIDFHPTGENAVVTNSFRIVMEEGVLLDGIVMWTAEEPRPNAIVSRNCPDGDVTGEEYAACTLWQGVVYAVDEKGEVGLLPSEGSPAPPRLVFADLGPALRASNAFGEGGFSKVPFDVFELKGCQE
ncbi:MAG: hypothetical protein M9924_07985 [Rhizobiaceae bacterium]|nr:hypothetical protein [Rhizobiaceae bacterium]